MTGNVHSSVLKLATQLTVVLLKTAKLFSVFGISPKIKESILGYAFLRDRIQLFRVKTKTLYHAYVGYDNFHFDETSQAHGAWAFIFAFSHLYIFQTP